MSSLSVDVAGIGLLGPGWADWASTGIDLLVIDEISMVRADVLDGIDEVLRRHRDRSRPFGGVQLLMIGDLHQLPPVVKDEEWNLLREQVFHLGQGDVDAKVAAFTARLPPDKMALSGVFRQRAAMCMTPQQLQNLEAEFHAQLR